MSKNPERANKPTIAIPDDAIGYIVTQHLQRQVKNNAAIVKGVPFETVEEVVGLFFEWAEKEGLIRDGVLSSAVFYDE